MRERYGCPHENSRINYQRRQLEHVITSPAEVRYFYKIPLQYLNFYVRSIMKTFL